MNYLNKFFSAELENLKCCDNDTRAYIVSILDKFKSAINDYSKDSLTIKYAEARYTQDFYTFQNIGDWLFFTNSLFPEHLKNASKEYYYSIGQLSYYSCYNLTGKKWKLYQQMADMFPILSSETGKIIRKY